MAHDAFKSSDVLTTTANETRAIIPYLLLKRPDAAATSTLYDSRHDLHALHQHHNPNLSCHVSVINADAFDVALSMISSHHSSSSSSSSSKPPLVLNMANAYTPGGGWAKGALSQEESLCYRSSLSATLKRNYYPWKQTQGIYSPRVLVIRESLARGHALLDLNRPEEMPVVSVVSVAALRGPETRIGTRSGEVEYVHDRDREIMRAKVRFVLRVAGRHGHRRLVLGTLGCGAFQNPSEEVARLWREELERDEMRGWFEAVIFAVLTDEEGPKSNFGVFRRELERLKI